MNARKSPTARRQWGSRGFGRPTALWRSSSSNLPAGTTDTSPTWNPPLATGALCTTSRHVGFVDSPSAAAARPAIASAFSASPVSSLGPRISWPPSRRTGQSRRHIFESRTSRAPAGLMSTWSTFALPVGRARSCRMCQPSPVRGRSSLAVRCSPIRPALQRFTCRALRRISGVCTPTAATRCCHHRRRPTCRPHAATDAPGITTPPPQRPAQARPTDAP